MLHALFAAFLLILSSELGDRTFFLTTLLSASSNSVLGVFTAALGALTVVCGISVGLGRALTNIVAEKWLVMAGGLIMVLVGALMLLDQWKRVEDRTIEEITPLLEEESLEPARTSSPRTLLTPRYSLLRTFSLIFAAEWGDRSQLALIALAVTEKEPLAVFLGAVLGHAVCTAVACKCGAIVNRYFTLKTVNLLAASLFISFGVITVVYELIEE